MPDKNIKPDMRVYLKSNLYDDPKLDKMLARPIHERVGMVLHKSGYDEEWGPRWIVHTEEGNIDMSEQNLSPIPNLAPEVTGRGFGRREFMDMYGSTCSVQDSSLATDDAIWLGVNDGEHFECKPPYNKSDGSNGGRMHLSRGHVAALLPILQHFVNTGMLPED